MSVFINEKKLNLVCHSFYFFSYKLAILFYYYSLKIKPALVIYLKTLLKILNLKKIEIFLSGVIQRSL